MPNQEQISKIIPLLSSARFESYRKRGDTAEHALARVNWNTALCEALYPCIQAVEVGFRNRLHQSISAVCADANWIINPTFLKPQEAEMVESAKKALRIRNRSDTTGYLIAELRFGFWTSLADSRYETIWHKIIRMVVPAMPNTLRTRSEVSARLHTVRHLRNSVFHHHSIWHWCDLERQYNDVYMLLGWLDPAYSFSVKRHDRFPEILAGGYSLFL